MQRKVIKNASEFFDLRCPADVLVRRSAVLEILKQLDDRGLQVYGMEGGPLFSDGSYMLKMASCFDKKIMTGDPGSAGVINNLAIESLKEDPPEWDVYELRVTEV
ncbi:hypothetical protein [Labrenzia sp. PHM005]|uniref:hypothetical protein n=1 Tax=Labrenzia sp. PHM005 TaxID=2590016 RepID=UPI001140547D|nr:hypothetical protein [Labrenzia sp. PHM005]QDG78364.1 hypothetical protein FJ695_22265 [Labrenzia sp. PHM005]